MNTEEKTNKHELFDDLRDFSNNLFEENFRGQGWFGMH